MAEWPQLSLGVVQVALLAGIFWRMGAMREAITNLKRRVAALEGSEASGP